MKEQALQTKILKHLKENGCYARKITTANYTGTPDILACISGKFVAIEVKSPGNKASTLQKYNIEKIRQAGGWANCFDNYEDYERMFNIITGKI